MRLDDIENLLRLLERFSTEIHRYYNIAGRPLRRVETSLFSDPSMEAMEDVSMIGDIEDHVAGALQHFARRKRKADALEAEEQ